jgi:hypothetical protein
VQQPGELGVPPPVGVLECAAREDCRKTAGGIRGLRRPAGVTLLTMGSLIPERSSSGGRTIGGSIENQEVARSGIRRASAGGL